MVKCISQIGEINKLIFETIYHASVECSMEIAKERSQRMHYIATQHRYLFSDVDVEHLSENSKQYTKSRNYLPNAESDEFIK